MRVNCRKIMFVIPIAVGYFGEVLRGFAAYAMQDQSWEFDFYRGMKRAIPAIERSKPDGIVLHIGKRERPFIDALRQFNLPYLLISDELGTSDPRVGLDEYAIGCMGAEYLLELGFRHFGYCGYSQTNYALGREAGFTARIREQQRSLRIFHSDLDLIGTDTFEREMGNWLNALDRPAGILACHDLLGLHVVQRCRHIGLRVPEDIAVLGVDNCRLECEFTHPPLSSVDPGSHRVGYQAAQQLDAQMNGQRPPEKPVLIKPVGIVRRQSTDILAIDDPLIADALQLIRQHAGRPISVDDVTREIPLSRRRLERQFKKLLGRSPLAEIRRMHVQRAKELLTYTDLPLEAIASRSGLGDAVRLCHVFRRETGMTPRSFRQQCRAGTVKEIADN